MSDLSQKWQHHWHPCTQMKDFETFPPLDVVHAEGGWLTLTDGQKVFDATSSWWCKHLGHRQPKLLHALRTQSEKMIHTIAANTLSEPVVELSSRLSQLMPNIDRVFYASDGSSAVEIALKMACHAQHLRGNKRNHIIKLSGAYHGETIMTMAVSDCELYKGPYKSWMVDTTTIDPIPYVAGTHDPIWSDASDMWYQIEQVLEPHAQTACAVIVEPLLQGANHMKIYSKDFLKRLAIWAKKHNIYFIADEIMTGFWRTGSLLASMQADIQPDFICLGKGLTSGMLPLSATLTSNDIFKLFYGTKETHSGFLHSHTYSAHALAAAVACSTLDVYEQSNMASTVENIGALMLASFNDINAKLDCLTNIRQIGGVVAAELSLPDCGPRVGWRLQQLSVQYGALIRPLGNTLYWCPPLNSSPEEIAKLKVATESAITALLESRV